MSKIIVVDGYTGVELNPISVKLSPYLPLLIRLKELMPNFRADYFQFYPARNYGRMKMIASYLNEFLSNKISNNLQV